MWYKGGRKLSFPFDDFPRQTVALIFTWGVRASVLASFFRSPPAVSRAFCISLLSLSRSCETERVGKREKEKKREREKKQKLLPMIGAKLSRDRFRKDGTFVERTMQSFIAFARWIQSLLHTFPSSKNCRFFPHPFFSFFRTTPLVNQSIARSSNLRPSFVCHRTKYDEISTKSVPIYFCFKKRSKYIFFTYDGSRDTRLISSSRLFAAVSDLNVSRTAHETFMPDGREKARRNYKRPSSRPGPVYFARLTAATSRPTLFSF